VKEKFNGSFCLNTSSTEITNHFTYKKTPKKNLQKPVDMTQMSQN